MGLSEESDENVEEKFEELCLDLNMDKRTKEESWKNYQKIKKNYLLEGDQIHWLACALYESCRRSKVPTVGRGTVEGNCVSLTRLLRSSRFSLIQFFNKMKKWSDMASLSQEFRDKVNRLERNFAVSTVIFKKFEPIFLAIFKSPADEAPRQPRSRKQRKLPCSLQDVFNFCWTMFVQVKGNFPAISDDLVNSYHLLLCNIDWFYGNALLGGRKDLLNPEFSGLPDDFNSKDWRAPSETPCIIKHLCDKHEGLEIEAKVIKEHWWKPHLKKLFDKKVLKGKLDTLSAVLDIGNFEANKKSINNSYEEYVLSVGDFDERIFLDEDADEEIGTPARSREDVTGELTERMQQRSSLQQHVDQTRSLAPSTPLTGRRYLKEKDVTITPVSTATQSVSRLQHLLSGRKTAPSDCLQEQLLEVGGQPLLDTIQQRVKDMGEIFCNHYVQPAEHHPGSQMDFAKRRLQLGESLYYKALENIAQTEKSQRGNSISGLLEHDLFHRCLFACCLEITIFSYNSQRMFPWIVEIFDLSPYHFYKVVELIVREEEGLTRDVVKHLNHIEECILEYLAWQSDSPVWEAIKVQGVPQSAEVALPLQANTSQNSLWRKVLDKNTGSKDPLLSPTGPSAADRFSSPSPGSAKRRLFLGEAAGKTRSGAESQAKSGLKTISITTQNQTQHLVAFQQIVTHDGRQVLIPVQTLAPPTVVSSSGTTVSTGSSPEVTGDGKTKPVLHTPGHPRLKVVESKPATSEPSTAPTTTQASSPSKTQAQSTAQQGKPAKGGSLAIFFRKVYHLAHVRLKDLCEKLDVQDEDLHRQMWTCLEHVIIQHTELLRDRHLDQLIMCSIYIIAKVTGKSQAFQDIMKCYRLQPQAQSHVYRSVLLTSRGRHTSGSSDGSQPEASGTSSPVNGEKEIYTREKRAMPVRSSSTLPVPHPNSHPPTPTRLVGTGSCFEFGEERGDLIQFYNQVFVTQIRKFATRFSANNQNGDVPPLSPLPPTRCHTTSPRRVSQRHSVYISPHKVHRTKVAAENRLLYCFDRNPSKSLQMINNMIRIKSEAKTENKLDFTRKRPLEADEEEEGAISSPKRLNLFRRLQDVTSDRQESATKIVIVK
ncbi:retinoblastoma-like protein 1 isoform X2 [Mya arenaria]|uniref:retinoblastoma-like protein 1 isoform X2 n=1 Tax=Mya arenaria TaxID=6604 RepID=UPI0022E333E5|nr:retinoblastoma-like protein 1 isoform X2 [Mya arenaria]